MDHEHIYKPNPRFSFAAHRKEDLMHVLRRIGALVLILRSLLSVAALSVAGVTINSWSIGGGGSTHTSAGNISLGGALGQAIAGRSSSVSLELQSGFWSGAGAQSDQGHTRFVPVILNDD